MTPETTTTPTEISVIVLPAELPEQSKLPAALLTNIHAGFDEAFRAAGEMRVKALAITVKDHKDFEAMREAKRMRLDLRTIRTNADKKRAALKSDALLYGKALDGTYNILEAAIKPLEAHLQNLEDTAALYIEREKARVLNERMEAIRPYLRPDAPLPDLVVLDETQWATYLEDARILHEARAEKERKEAAEKLAAEQAAAAEKDRLRIENERLQAEAEAAAKERARVANEARAALEAAQAEINAEKAKAAAAKVAAEAAAKAAAEATAKAAAADAARVAAAAKAKKDAEAAEARRKADADKAEQDRLDAIEKAKRDAAAAEAARVAAAAKAAADAKAAQEKAAATARRKAERAPDKAKLETVAAAFRAIHLPPVASADTLAVLREVRMRADDLAAWIESQAAQM